jgi:hypothetical protein
MPKVVYTPARGLVQEGGSGFETSTFPFAPSVTVITTVANNTGSLPGVYTVTAGGVATVKMPLASAYPGGLFIFRNGDNGNANILTGSGEAAGTTVFTDGTSKGSRLTLSAVVGSSVALASDGVNYLVMSNSGSLTFAGT